MSYNRKVTYWGNCPIGVMGFSMKYKGYKFALVHDGDIIAKEPNTNFGLFELIRQGRELLNKRLVQFQLEIHVLDTTNKFVKVIEDHRKGW